MPDCKALETKAMIDSHYHHQWRKGTDMRKRFPQQDLADRLRAALESAGVSQAELARACDVTEQSVHGWVTNGRIAKQHLPTIAALTGKSLDYFLVGLKTWRRAAALALPFLSLMPLAESVARTVRCILCQISRRDRPYVRYRTLLYS